MIIQHWTTPAPPGEMVNKFADVDGLVFLATPFADYSARVGDVLGLVSSRPMEKEGQTLWYARTYDVKDVPGRAGQLTKVYREWVYLPALDDCLEWAAIKLREAHAATLIAAMIYAVGNPVFELDEGQGK